jgi:hypothetical protein
MSNATTHVSRAATTRRAADLPELARSYHFEEPSVCAHLFVIIRVVKVKVVQQLMPSCVAAQQVVMRRRAFAHLYDDDTRRFQTTILIEIIGIPSFHQLFEVQVCILQGLDKRVMAVQQKLLQTVGYVVNNDGWSCGGLELADVPVLRRVQKQRNKSRAVRHL